MFELVLSIVILYLSFKLVKFINFAIEYIFLTIDVECEFKRNLSKVIKDKELFLNYLYNKYSRKIDNFEMSEEDKKELKNWLKTFIYEELLMQYSTIN